MTGTVTLNAAGGYCHQVEVDYGLQDTVTRQMLAWFKMFTFYCWNNRIVTYHDTWFNGSTTGLGSGFGWRYNASDLTSTHHCYYNTSVWCSGNFEEGQGSFQACIGVSPFDVCYSNWDPVLRCGRSRGEPGSGPLDETGSCRGRHGCAAARHPGRMQLVHQHASGAGDAMQ
jgi:hypothetical protein